MAVASSRGLWQVLAPVKGSRDRSSLSVYSTYTSDKSDDYRDFVFVSYLFILNWRNVGELLNIPLPNPSEIAAVLCTCLLAGCYAPHAICLCDFVGATNYGLT